MVLTGRQRGTIDWGTKHYVNPISTLTTQRTKSKKDLQTAQ